VQQSAGNLLLEAEITGALDGLVERNKGLGFIRLEGLFIVRGVYPDWILKAWDKWSAKSLNDRPDFADDQLYICVLLENGGKDLESFRFTSCAGIHGVITQTILALAVAERELRFEHRDLHWGMWWHVPYDR
jgi:hypothetical protein